MSEPVSTEQTPQHVADVASPSPVVETAPVTAASVVETAAVTEVNPVVESKPDVAADPAPAVVPPATETVTAAVSEAVIAEPTKAELLAHLYADLRDFINLNTRPTSDQTLALSNLNDSETWAKAALARS